MQHTRWETLSEKELKTQTTGDKAKYSKQVCLITDIKGIIHFAACKIF